LHPSTIDALRQYLQVRDRLAPAAANATAAVFVSTAGTRLISRNVRKTFHRLVQAAGLSPRPGAVPAAHARPAPQLRGPLHARRLRRWPGRADPADAHLDLPWPRSTGQYLPVPLGVPRVDGCRRATSGSAPGRSATSALTPTLQAFFTERLIRQRQASPHTIAAYRDTMRLLLAYVAGRKRHRTVEA
jgi:hypothetical protein